MTRRSIAIPPARSSTPEPRFPQPGFLVRAVTLEDPAADGLKSVDFARRALEVAGDDPSILANAALALSHFGEDIGSLIGLIDRALALNPGFARGWHISGILRIWADQPDIAIEHLEASLRFSPRARIGTSLSAIGHAHFVGRRFAEAVPKLLLAIQEDPASRRRIAFSPPATPIWAGATTPERSSGGCVPLPLS